MSRSIVPNKEVFQYAIRYLPTGKYLKKTPGSSFYETDIPGCYNSAKVAARSLATSFEYLKRYDPKDCEIVKFRLFMEEVKELSKKEVECEKEISKITQLREVLGETCWEVIENWQDAHAIFSYVQHLDNRHVDENITLHGHIKTFKTAKGLFQFVWSHNQKHNEAPVSILEGTDYNWDRKIEELKKQHGM